jgi:hypothetical protein
MNTQTRRKSRFIYKVDSEIEDRGYLILYLFNPASFYWNAYEKPGKWVVMYICARGIEFVFVSTIVRLCGMFCVKYIQCNILFAVYTWHDLSQYAY